MALFVEVQSVDKNCPVIINLDHVVEIAPLVSGGCALFMTDPAGVNSKSSIRVKDNYDLFKQFAMQTVTADDIARRFPKVSEPKAETKADKKKEAVDAPLDIPKL